MRTKNQEIEHTKRYLSWVNAGSKWLTKKEAKLKNQARDKILRLISDRVKYAFKQSKIYSGALSPGCLICGQGKWSCMYINGLCTANCFFCPQDRKIKKERPPNAEGIVFSEPNSYVDYLEKFGFSGVGFSGGESMLVFEKLLTYITRIRKKFGKNFYLWIYTNGALVNVDKLKRLKSAGLDEIRFNISANNYDLQPVELATAFINTVTVEVPAIPEDYEVLKNCIFKMQEIGVKYLNLHQLIATEYNYRNFISRNYTFLCLPSTPVFESEMTALKLIKYAVDSNIKLPINYCSKVYKNRFQSRGHRKRAASLVRKDYEEETDSGYIRHLSVKGSLPNLRNIDKILRANQCPKKLWLLDDTEMEISFHSAILKYINFEKYNLIIRYFAPGLKIGAHTKKNYKENKLNFYQGFFEKKLVAQPKELTSVGVESFLKLFIKNMNEAEVFKYFYENYNLKTEKNVKNMKKEAAILTTLKGWEQVAVGFPEIC